MTSDNWGGNGPQDQQPFGGGPGDGPPGGWPSPQPNHPAPGGSTPFPNPAVPQQPQPYPTPGNYGAPAPGNYGAPPAAAPPARKSRKWLWFLLAIPLLILLGIGGCTAFLLNAVSGPIDATNAFVAEMDEGDFQAAYASLCESTKASAGADAWISEVRTALGGEITGYSFTNVSVEGTGDGSVATVTGTIEVDGQNRNVAYGLVQENGDWRVCTAA